MHVTPVACIRACQPPPPRFLPPLRRHEFLLRYDCLRRAARRHDERRRMLPQARCRASSRYAAASGSADFRAAVFRYDIFCGFSPLLCRRAAMFVFAAGCQPPLMPDRTPLSITDIFADFADSFRIITPIISPDCNSFAASRHRLLTFIRQLIDAFAIFSADAIFAIDTIPPVISQIGHYFDSRAYVFIFSPLRRRFAAMPQP